MVERRAKRKGRHLPHHLRGESLFSLSLSLLLSFSLIRSLSSLHRSILMASKMRQENITEDPPVTQITEAEMEAQLFAQSSSIDSLLSMMRGLEGRNEDISDNDELQVRRL